MNEFNIGDTVTLLADGPKDLYKGDVGTIVGFDPPANEVAVDWGKDMFYGHSCGGLCLDGHGWWVDPIDLKLGEHSYKDEIL